MKSLFQKRFVLIGDRLQSGSARAWQKSTTSPCEPGARADWLWTVELWGLAIIFSFWGLLCRSISRNTVDPISYIVFLGAYVSSIVRNTWCLLLGLFFFWIHRRGHLLTKPFSSLTSKRTPFLRFPMGPRASTGSPRGDTVDGCELLHQLIGGLPMIIPWFTVFHS